MSKHEVNKKYNKTEYNRIQNTKCNRIRPELSKHEVNNTAGYSNSQQYCIVGQSNSVGTVKP